MRRFAALALTLLLAGFLSACGDDADTSTPADTATDATAEATDAPEDDAGDAGDDPDDGASDDGSGAAPSTGEAGTATVAGTTYNFDRALRCDPDSLGVEGVVSDIEAQFFANVDGDRIQLDLMTSELAGMPMHSVSWAGPEGIFGASFTQIGDSWMGEGDDVYQDAPVVVSGDRATGSVVLYDSMTMEDTIEVDFDVTIPSDTFACR